MLFDLAEVSNYAGRPTYLFEFGRGAQTFRYAAADRDVIVDGNTYTAAAISCSAIRQTGDTQSDEFTITLPTSLTVVSDFVLVPPSERVTAVVKRYHRDGDDAVVRYSGFVDRIKRVSTAKSEVICKALTATFRRAGVRLPWQRQCPHALYDVSCRVNKAAYATSAVVSSKDGINVTASGLAAAGAGRLTGGFIEWTTADGIKAWRAITAHDTTTIALLGGTTGLDVGDTIVAYPGCPHTAEGCNTLFNNLPNFGGFRHLPSKSPFDGDPVF